MKKEISNFFWELWENFKIFVEAFIKMIKAAVAPATQLYIILLIAALIIGIGLVIFKILELL